MKRGNLETGVLGERVALQFLQKKGFTLITKNYRQKCGEIDIIAQKSGIVHFVEVKSVSDHKNVNFSRENTYDPEEMATNQKLEKVTRTAVLYMENTKDKREYQIDVVTVHLDHENRIARCAYYPQALKG